MAKQIQLDDASVRALNSLSKTLDRYVALSGKSIDETLNRKGNDLRIKLFRAYRKKRARSRFEQQARARARRGVGLTVRMDEISTRYSPPEVDKNGRPLTLWQKLYWQELKRRKQGIGVLGVSFLDRRYRSNQTQGRYLTINRSGQLGEMARFEKGNGFFRITGFTAGLAQVDKKYGLVRDAVTAVENDTLKYIERKEKQRLERAARRQVDGGAV